MRPQQKWDKKPGDCENRRDSWFENRLVYINVMDMDKQIKWYFALIVLNVQDNHSGQKYLFMFLPTTHSNTNASTTMRLFHVCLSSLQTAVDAVDIVIFGPHKL